MTLVTFNLNESFTGNILKCLTYFMHFTKKCKIVIYDSGYIAISVNCDDQHALLMYVI